MVGSPLATAQEGPLVGPSRDWIEVGNPDSPAMLRHREERW
jgi:hypothetical protein